MSDHMNWVDETEKVNQEEKAKDYFNMQEGDNKFLLLSHCAPLRQKWTGSKYELAEDGDEGVSIKGVCWVLQDGVIKSAKLPYTVVKHIRSYQNNDEWELGEFPWTHMVTVNAKGAGTKEVEYTTTLSPKQVEISEETLKELKEKPQPEEIVEKIRAKSSKTAPRSVDYPKNDINPDDIPFN